MNKPSLWMICLACTVLGACGGDNDANSVADSIEVPASASQSAEGMAGYIGQLAADNSDTREALDLAKYAPPTAEDTEPLAVQ